MNLEFSNTYKINRLTSVWAFSEAGLGGILHAFKMPFTGLFVGGIAIILISLIASYTEKNKAKGILRACLIVLIIKMLVSPHSPITAYIAVIFQSFVGAILFTIIPNVKIAAMFLSIFGMLESALQKLLTLTIVYSISIWDALDEFVNFVLKQIHFELQIEHFSFYAIGIYLFIYLIGGIIIGYLAGKINSDISKVLKDKKLVQKLLKLENHNVQFSRKKQRIKFRNFLIFCLILFFILIFIPFFQPENQQVSTAIYIITRSILVLIVWYFLLAPILLFFLKKYLKHKQNKYQSQITENLKFIEELKNKSPIIWQISNFKKGINRLYYFLILTITFAICKS